MQKPADSAGPTVYRLDKSGGDFHLTGRSKRERRYTMQDDALERAWRARWVADVEYAALARYRDHWASAGFAGAMQTLDLDRVFAFDPSTMSGLSKSERQQDHRDAYREARCKIGTRPALVADGVACFGMRLVEVGIVMLGYRSKAHARDEARAILRDAGFRLSQFWRDRDRRR
jgi:hypothetical protein